MIKFAALGMLGYAGYKYYKSNAEKLGRRSAVTPPNAVPGGPLSDNANINSSISSSINR